MNSRPDLYCCSVTMDFLHGSADPVFLQIDIPGNQADIGPVANLLVLKKWHSGDGL